MTIAAPTVRILVCGSADRGDDGAAVVAMAHLLPTLPPPLCTRIEVRRCAQLDAADLIDVAPDERCLVVDTAGGLDPGAIVVCSLEELLAPSSTIAPRSAHALPIRQTLLVASTMRGTLPAGTFIGIGGKWYGYGQRFSRAVKSGLEALQAAIVAELVTLTGVTLDAAAAVPEAATPCGDLGDPLPSEPSGLASA